MAGGDAKRAANGTAADGASRSSSSSAAASSSSGDSDLPTAASVSASNSARTEDEHGEQPLQTPWTFWFDRVSSAAYAEALQRLGTVHTVQGFWRYYCNLTRPAQLQPGDNYHLFRGAVQPAQEMLPGGGCWSVRVPRGKVVDVSDGAGGGDADELLNLYWEKLLLCLVGESLGEQCIAGAGVSVRKDAVSYTHLTLPTILLV